MGRPRGHGGSLTINRDGKSFFDVLPRELRDRIYEYTFDNDVRDGHFRYQFKAPQFHLRLVNRQFMHEYDEQTPLETTLYVSARTNQFERTSLGPSDGLPSLATRCTAADVTLYIGDTEGLATDLKGEHWFVQGSLFDRLFNIERFIGLLPRLEDIRVQLDLNFARSFDTIHELTNTWLLKFRHYYQNPSRERSYEPNTDFELHHLGLGYPDLPSCLTSNIPNSEILQRPAILAAFSVSYGRVKKEVRHRQVKRRTRVEATVLAAWESQHGCTLSQSAKKAAGIVDKILDRDSS